MVLLVQTKIGKNLTNSTFFSQILPYPYKFFLILTNSTLFLQILSYSYKFYLIPPNSILSSQILPVLGQGIPPLLIFMPHI